MMKMNKDDNPKISIIVPCYNVEQYIETCVKSVLNQTYSNWELVLVDDGSKDSTSVLCDSFSALDSRITVIHKSNGGLVSARNAGYEVVSGDWLTYLDGDDWISASFCEKIVNVLKNHEDIDLIFFCISQEIENKTVKGKWNWNQYKDGRVYNHVENQYLSAYSLNYHSGLSDAVGKVYRTKWCKQCGIVHNPLLRQGEESVEFVMRAFYSANKSVFLKELLYHYRYNDSSISKMPDERNVCYIVDCMNSVKAFINEIPNNAIFIKEFEFRNAYLLISIAMHIYFNPNNSISYKERKMKYENLIQSNSLFVSAVENVKSSQFDILRGLAFMCIKHKFFHGLNFIGKIKHLALRMSYFNY